VSHHIHEDIWYEQTWGRLKKGTVGRVPTGNTKTVRYVRVGLDQAQVLHKAGVTVYKWTKARRRGMVCIGTLDLWWTSYHLERCKTAELSRLHANDVHHKTLAAIKRGTVSYCVLVDGDEVQTG
jgi:hypothetical protein